MTHSPTGYFSLLILSSGILAGCNKSISNTDTATTNTGYTPIVYFTTDPAKSPWYGESTLYVEGSGRSAYLHSPVNKLGEGTFIAWPKGLTIDAHTGVIDILQSEPGARYNIGFVNAATKDTAYNQVILAGISYSDGLYYMESEDSVLLPYYNNEGQAPWATGSNDKQAGLDPASGSFDDAAAGQSANDQELFVNTTTGTINLNKSVREGLFGKNPQNGNSRQIAVYYRLNDRSSMNLQKTTLTLYYYNTLTDVPANLANTVRTSQTAFRQTQNRETGAGGVQSTAVAPAASTSTLLAAAPKAAPAPPRPPQIVIVNKGHP